MKRGEGEGRCSGIAGAVRRRAGVTGLIVLVLLLHSPAWARVGGPCVNCHTMHNSQDGAGVVDSTIEMQPALTTTDCVGCHSSDSETIRDLGDGTRIPIVYTANAPNLEPGTSTSMLAGGNFHWVALGDDSKGHNVFGISEIDQALSIAPGKPGGVCDPCHKSLAYPKPYPSGCTGCHLPAHHADDSATVVDGDHGSYRFLGNLMAKVFGGWPYSRPDSGGGVRGIEDEDWEQSVSSTDHNTYSGTEVVYPPSPYSYLKNDAIGEVCTGCHGVFHSQMNTDQPADVSGVWIRHPSDVLIPDSGEYATYTTYNPLAPAAKQDLTADMKNSPTVVPGSDVVTCISCHRPHGSPYSDMLRWDYDSCSAGNGSSECGCYVCHTAKDQ